MKCKIFAAIVSLLFVSFGAAAGAKYQSFCTDAEKTVCLRFSAASADDTNGKNPVYEYRLASKATKSRFIYLGNYLRLFVSGEDAKKLYSLAFGRGYPDTTRNEYIVERNSLRLQRTISFLGSDDCFDASSNQCLISALVKDYRSDSTTVETKIENISEAQFDACTHESMICSVPDAKK